MLSLEARSESPPSVISPSSRVLPAASVQLRVHINLDKRAATRSISLVQFYPTAIPTIATPIHALLYLFNALQLQPHISYCLIARTLWQRPAG